MKTKYETVVFTKCRSDRMWAVDTNGGFPVGTIRKNEKHGLVFANTTLGELRDICAFMEQLEKEK